MRQFGLIGYPLTHSFSQKFFSEKFKNEGIEDTEYQNFEIDSIQSFMDIIKSKPDLAGLNVTIPYKEQVMTFLDNLDVTAKEVGAVNTVKIIRNGDDISLTGYNTDVYGFEITLKRLLTNEHNKALILGTGGASKAIKYVLSKLKIDFISASIEELKENEIRYEDIDEEMINSRKIIINATPLGTFPKIDNCPSIPYQHITEKHILYDLVYNPEITKFMQKGIDNGAQTTNGLNMLHLQAEKAWDIWNKG